MKTIKHLLFLYLIVFLSNILLAQETPHLDSLKNSELNPNVQLESLLHLIDSLYTNDPDLCIEYANEALQIAEENNDMLSSLMVKNRMAHIYWEKSDFNAALSTANEVKSLANKEEYKSEYAEAILVISKVYVDLGDFVKSSEMAFEALRIFEDKDDKIGICKALYRIGNIYFEQSKYEKALEYDQKSLALSNEIDYLVGISRGLNNVAAVYANMGEFDSFELHMKKAIIINKKIGRKLWEGVNYFNLAIINRERKKYDSAYYFYQKAESIFLQLNNLTKLSAINSHYSKYYQETGVIDTSIYYANKSFVIAKNHQLTRSMFLSATRLHYIYQEINNVDSAYKYSQIQYQMKDSLDLEKSMNRILQLELLYEFEKQEQLKKTEQQRLVFYYILVGVIIISFFVLIIIVLIARHRLKVKNNIIKRKELENQLEIKNKELTSNVMSLMRKNEILSEIADKLLKVRDDAVKDETKLAIKKIASELEQSNDKEIWEEFEVRFQQVHSDFYENLLKKHPDLSPSEQKLCAFLRLNMTTKEISELTGQRTSSLEIARARLRKKLGITNTKENLVSFLSRI